MVLFKYILSLFEGIIWDMMVCSTLVAWKHIFWHYSVMELKTTQPEDFHCMLLSCECQILLRISSYSLISSAVKGTQCMCIVLFLVSIPLFYSEVLYKSVTTSWHFISPHSQTHCGINKINFHSVFFTCGPGQSFLGQWGSEGLGFWILEFL